MQMLLAVLLHSAEQQRGPSAQNRPENRTLLCQVQWVVLKCHLLETLSKTFGIHLILLIDVFSPWETGCQATLLFLLISISQESLQVLLRDI